MPNPRQNRLSGKIGSFLSGHRWDRIWRHAVISAVYFVVFLALDRLILLMPTSYLTPGWYPPEGVSVALMAGISPLYALWFSACWILVTVVNYPVLAFKFSTILGAVVYGINFGLAAMIIRRWKIHLRMNKLRAVGSFILINAVALILGELFFTAGLVADGLLPSQRYWVYVTGASLGGVVVISTMAPFLLVYIIPYIRKRFLLEEQFMQFSGTHEADSTAIRLDENAEPSAQEEKVLDEKRVNWSKVWRHAVISAVYFVVFLALDRLVLLIPMPTSYFTPGWYPPVGVSIALMAGISPLYAIWFSACWILVTVVNYPALAFKFPNILGAVVYGVNYGLAAMLIRRLKIHSRMNKLRAVASFILINAMALILGEFFFTAGLVADGLLPRQRYWAYVMGASLGGVVVISSMAPFLLVYVVPYVRRFLLEQQFAQLGGTSAPDSTPIQRHQSAPATREGKELGGKGVNWSKAWRHGVIAIVYAAAFVGLDKLVTLLPTNYLAPGWYPPMAISIVLMVGISPLYAFWFAVWYTLVPLVNYPTGAWTYSTITGAIAFGATFGLAAMFMRRLKIHLQINKLRAVALFILVSSIAVMIGEIFYTAGLLADGLLSRERYWWYWAAGCLGDVVVISGVGPFLLAYAVPYVRRRFLLEEPFPQLDGAHEADSSSVRPTEKRRSFQPALFKDWGKHSNVWRGIENVGMALGVILSLWLALSHQLSQRLDLLYICFLPIVWIGMRRGLTGVTVGLFAFSVVPFLVLRTTPTDSAQFTNVRLLLALLSLTGLTVGGLVTDRESAHRAIADMAHRFKHMLDKSYERILLLNERGDILYDAGGPVVLGHSPEKFLNRSCFDFLHPDDRPVVRDVFSRALQRPGTTATTECRGHAADGSCRWLELTLTNWLEDPTIRALVLNYRDVTQRKAAVDALQRSEARYRGLFMNSAFGMYCLSPDGDILDVNAAFMKMFGFASAQEVRGVHARELLLDVPASDDQASTSFENFDVRELTLKRKDGSQMLARLLTRQVTDAQGGLAYLEGMVEDITEHRNLEAQLRQSQKLEALGQLAGGVAHDFNNMLGVILGYSEILQESLPAEDAGVRMISEIKKAGDRAAHLTQQLLAFSRKQVLQATPLDLNRAVCDMGELLGRLIGENIKFVTQLDPNLAPIKADPSQIGQVIMNLAVNARDAMPGGGILTIKTINVLLRDRAKHPVPSGEYVLLQVTDTGAGMDAETKSRIFEPFFTTKPKEKGTGLGLATVYGIVKQSGGFILVDSAPHCGSTFEIYFPAMKSAVKFDEKRPIRAARPRNFSPGTYTVMVVEDEPALRQLTSDVLSSKGFVVLDAPDAATALRIANEHPGVIHLLITDVILPGMNGNELAQALCHTRPEVCVLFVSGYARDIRLELGGNFPAAFLQKPLEPNTLLEKSYELLAESSARVSVTAGVIPHSKSSRRPNC